MVFGTSGLLSFDYGYQDMSNAELRPTSDPDFNSENQFISQQLGGVSTFRAGGEYRLKQLSLRGGTASNKVLLKIIRHGGISMDIPEDWVSVLDQTVWTLRTAKPVRTFLNPFLNSV